MSKRLISLLVALGLCGGVVLAQQGWRVTIDGVTTLIGTAALDVLVLDGVNQDIQLSRGGAGFLDIAAVGLTNNEVWRVDLETTANTLTWATSTGVTNIANPFDLTMGSGTQIRFDNLEGTAADPSIAWADASGNYDSGFFQPFSDAVSFASASVERIQFNFSGFLLADNATIGWDDGATIGIADAALNRDAPNIIAQRVGTNAQEGRIYNTDSGSNDEFLSIGFINNSNIATFAIEATGTGTVRSFQFDGGDIVVSDSTNGGDAGARNTLTANFNIRVKSLGTMTNGSTETIALFDDTPAGECAEVGGQTVTDESTIRRVGTNSLKLAFEATPADGEGVDCTITSDNFEANESIGFWFYTDTTLAAGDLYVELDDTDETDTTHDLPAVTVLNAWSWIELDISTCATCDTIDGVKILVDVTGGASLGSANVYFDFMHKWDLDDEETLSHDIVQDGVLGCTVLIDATGSEIRPIDLVENTDFFINYQSTDAIVTVTNQSTKSGMCYLAII